DAPISTEIDITIGQEEVFLDRSAFLRRAYVCIDAGRDDVACSLIVDRAEACDAIYRSVPVARLGAGIRISRVSAEPLIELIARAGFHKPIELLGEANIVRVREQIRHR